MDPDPVSFQPHRVVIVDDHGSFRAVARELLESHGFAVVGEAESARAAFEAVADVAPDAVVLDVNLPDGNGIEVCRALTQANPELAVLLVSAEADNGRWAVDCGAIGFVSKSKLGSADLVGLLGGDGAEELSDRRTG